MIKRTALQAIKAYKIVSQYFRQTGAGGIYYSDCRYQPTCSEYTGQAIDKYGVLRGTVKGFIRIIKCNPFSRGGVDVV